MEIPYMNPTQYAEHIIHLSKLIKNVEQHSNSLAHEFRRAIAKLEHHNNVLEAQLGVHACMD